MRVLVVEEESEVRRSLEVALHESGHDTVIARDAVEAQSILNVDPTVELAIVDWDTRGDDALALCRWLRASHRATYVYTLMLSARDRTVDRVTGLDAGADDFLLRPISHDELRARIRVGERILSIHRTLLAANVTLQKQAAHDELTQLLNRGAVLSHLDRDIAAAVRSRSPLAVMMIDLDHFKAVNDRHGHLVGDAVLRESARRLDLLVRDADVIGRYGGEEFLVVLTRCDAGGAATVGERLRKGLSIRAIETGAAPVEVTCSVGVVASSPTGSTTSESLITLADRALYRAKNEGRDRVVVVAEGEQIPA